MKELQILGIAILALPTTVFSSSKLEKLEKCWDKSYEYLGLITNENAFQDPYYNKKAMNDSECYALKGGLERERNEKVECFYIKGASGYKCGENAKAFQAAKKHVPQIGKDKNGFYNDWTSANKNYSNIFTSDLQNALPSSSPTALNFEIGHCISNKSKGYNLTVNKGFHPEIVKSCICLNEYYAKNSSYKDFESDEQANELRDAAYKNGIVDKCFEGVRKSVQQEKEKNKKIQNVREDKDAQKLRVKEEKSKKINSMFE